MVFGAKLRTVMSSIIRWRKGEILRAARMELSTDVVLLMVSNNTEHLAS
jgi:hypothetical protein